MLNRTIKNICDFYDLDFDKATLRTGESSHEEVIRVGEYNSDKRIAIRLNKHESEISGVIRVYYLEPMKEFEEYDLLTFLIENYII